MKKLVLRFKKLKEKKNEWSLFTRKRFLYNFRDPKNFHASYKSADYNRI